MMGLTPREATARFDDVIEFAELGEFTEMKLKNYSSGMLVRLGFSLMTHVDADVLLIDEVLAVGDASFQQKCFDAFARLHGEGRTIVLVTHDMAAVEGHCDRAILLESGRDGPGGRARRRRQALSRAQLRSPRAGRSRGRRERSARRQGHRGGDRTRVGRTGERVRPGRGDRARDGDRGRAPARPAGVRLPARQRRRALDLRPRADPARRSRTARARRARADPHPDRATRSAAGHYYIHAAVGRGFEGRDPVAFRKNVADFVVYGTRSFGGVVALECSAESVVEPRRDDGI